MIKITKPTWDWRQCQSCGGEDEIRDMSFKRDEHGSSSTISICKECRKKLAELIKQESAT
jgi:hypothetical protein